MTIPFRLLTLLLAASIGQKTPPATTTYHSDSLHLDYNYPTSFTNTAAAVVDQAMEEEKDKAQGVIKAAIGCISVPVTALDVSKGFRMIFLMRMDGQCLGAETSPEALPGVTNSFLSGSLKKFGEPTIGSPSNYEIAGHKAAVITGSVPSKQLGKPLYAAAVCVISAKDVACWQFLTAIRSPFKARQPSLSSRQICWQHASLSF
jgi:hypothetical protein